MKLNDARKILVRWDKQDKFLYSLRDLEKVLGETGETIRGTLKRLVAAEILERIARNLYLFSESRHIDHTLIELIASYLRRGNFVFESLESAASKWGFISQIPVDRITVMTTGRRGEYHTRFGTIEFIHTEADPTEIITNTVNRPNSPLPLATKEYTLVDLKRCRRSQDLILWEEFEDV